MIRIEWTGERNRPLTARDWCDCGTCQSYKAHTDPESVGFLSWSDESGVGCSIILQADEFAIVKEMLQNFATTSEDCIAALEKIEAKKENEQ